MTDYFSDEVPGEEAPAQELPSQGLPAPSVDIAAWDTQQKTIDQFIQAHFVAGSDFHIMKDKPSLGKAGAEKLARLLHLRATFQEDAATRKMLGDEPGLVCYLCDLYTPDGAHFAEGRGARHAKADPGDPNKTIKMAQKSAQIDATLRGLALSGKYTQDMEDAVPAPTGQPAPAARPPQALPAVGASVTGGIVATGMVADTLPDGRIIYKVLSDGFPANRRNGARYPGIPIYDSGLQASDINPDDVDANTLPDIRGWGVEWETFTTKAGKESQRVLRVVRPTSAGIHTGTVDDDDSDDVPF